MATTSNEDVLEDCVEAAGLETKRLLQAARGQGLDEEGVRKLAAIMRATAMVNKTEVELMSKVDPAALAEKQINAMMRNAERMEKAAQRLELAKAAARERKR